MSDYNNQYDPEAHYSRVERKKQEELEQERINEEISRHQAERKAKREAEKNKKFHKIDKSGTSETKEIKKTQTSQENPKPQKEKKKRKPFWRVFWGIVKLGLLACIVCAILVFAYVASVIKNAPDIETDNIYSLLSQSSVIYDDQGQVIDNIFSEKNRTIVEISEIPDYVQNAFVVLEDKTFWTHHGFNIIRIFGAIRDALVTGGDISGTSTITQQLARNLYLEDVMSTRSLDRKITEAYYSVILEEKLTKDQILEAYLNTVNFGCGYGIQTASQSYFSKDVSELTIAEAAALASLPQAPSAYALVLTVPREDIAQDDERLIYYDGDYACIWNDSAQPRMTYDLQLLYEQGIITEAQYNEYKDCQIKDIVNPSKDKEVEITTNYFADYVISTVISDLQTQFGYDYEKAYNMVYNGGLQIYSTLDSQAQSVIEKEFDNDDNYPVPTSYSTDSDGNIITQSGSITLYKYSNYFTKKGNFKLYPSEYEWQSDGSLIIKSGKRLVFYETTVNDGTEVSVEFKNMYKIEDGTFYTISGGYINIPQMYKSLNKEGDLVISAQFFTDNPEFFWENGDNLLTKSYTLRAKVIQPQSAMTIIDNATGAIKAMVGGRKVEGRMLYNRATSPRQPGSSIKPIAVYSAALQRSYELEKEGEIFPLVETGYDGQGTYLWGDYITAASIVDDEPLKVNGKIWPKNSYNTYKGLYTLRTALQQSVNVCSVKILSQVGVEYAFEHAKSFGLTTLVESGDANDVNLAALGVGGLTNGATTLEMASAYTTFVNEGIHKSYYCYDKVTNRSGAVLLEPIKSEDEVLDAGVAWIMRNILQTVVSQGIAGNATVSGQKVGGKTGTTDDNYDIWFDGFTANYTAALWIGNDYNIKLSSQSPMAAKLWSTIMKQVDGALGGTYSKKPDNVVSAVIDTQSGLLATEDSTYTRKEYFTKGTVPKDKGTLANEAEICTETGYLATPGCPETEHKEGIALPYVRVNASKKLKNAGLPVYYCYLHNTDPNEYPVDPDYEDDIVVVDPIEESTETDIEASGTDIEETDAETETSEVAETQAEAQPAA